MKIKNYTHEAIIEMERQRDDEYYNNYTEDKICDNGCQAALLFNIYGRLLCSDCIIEKVRNTFADMISEDSGDAGSEVLTDIFADFSDSEILTYIENRFEKI